MKHEYWYEEIRKLFKRLKCGVEIREFIEERRELNLYMDNLLVLMIDHSQYDDDKMFIPMIPEPTPPPPPPPRPKFFVRLWGWIKSFREIF